MVREFLNKFSDYMEVLSNLDSLEGFDKECTVYGFVTEFRPGHVRQMLSAFRQEILEDTAWQSLLEDDGPCKAEASAGSHHDVEDLAKVVVRCAYAAAANAHSSSKQASFSSTSHWHTACETSSTDITFENCDRSQPLDSQCTLHVDPNLTATNECFADGDATDEWAAMDAELATLGDEESPFPCGIGHEDAACHTDGIEEDDECPICYRAIERCVELPCGHCFCADCLLEVVVEYKKKECPICRGVLYTEQLKAPTSARSSAFYSYIDEDDVDSSARGYTCYFFLFDWFWYCSVTKSGDKDDSQGLLDSFRESIPDGASVCASSPPSSVREAPHGLSESPYLGNKERAPRFPNAWEYQV
jgi:hypothetical protein